MRFHDLLQESPHIAINLSITASCIISITSSDYNALEVASNYPSLKAVVLESCSSKIGFEMRINEWHIGRTEVGVGQSGLSNRRK